MVTKRVFSLVVVSAVLFTGADAQSARKIVGKEAEALISAAQNPIKTEVVAADQVATVAQEDQEQLSKNNVDDLVLQQEELEALAEKSPNDDEDQLALNEDMPSMEEFEAFMETPEAKEMIAQIEDFQKNNPEEFQKMMEEAEKMMLALQSGEGLDMGPDLGKQPVEAAPAA